MFLQSNVRQAWGREHVAGRVREYIRDSSQRQTPQEAGGKGIQESGQS